MNMRPLNDFVFVRQDMPPSMSPGGIALIPTEKPWSPENDVLRGEVVAVGPGKPDPKNPSIRLSMWGMKPGMRIMYSPNGNFKQKVDGEDLIVIRRDSVIGEEP